MFREVRNSTLSMMTPTWKQSWYEGETNFYNSALYKMEVNKLHPHVTF